MVNADRTCAGPEKDATHTLTVINLSVPVVVLCVFGALRFSRSAVLDWIAPVLFWAWVAATPVSAGLAIRRARHRGAKLLGRLNFAALAVWGVAVLGLLLLH
ncbi:hypothetical protein ACFL5O_09315 [Myxococcota bacterium]